MAERRKPGRPRESEPAPTKDAILEAALAVVAETGLQRASLGRVAERAGASKTSVLYHFRTRDGLVAALALKVLSDFQEGVAQGSRMAKGDLTRAETGVRSFFRREYRNSLLVMRELMTQGAFDPRMGDLVRLAVDTRVQMVASLLDLPAPLALSTARAMVMTVQGCADAWVCSGKDDPKPYLKIALAATRAIVSAAHVKAETPPPDEATS